MMSNNKDRYSTVAELTFDDLKQLMFVLRDLYPGDDPIEVKNNLVSKDVERFFPNMSMDQYLSLTYLCKKILEDDVDELDFNDFKESNKDLVIDKLGMSKPDPRRLWEGRLIAMESVFGIAEKFISNDTSPNKEHTQVYNAKTLNCLIKMEKCDPYIYNRKLMIERMASLGITNKKITFWENILKRHNCDYTVLNKMVQYVKTKKYNEIAMFFNHFVERLELLGKEDCLENEVCVEFLNNIKKLTKKV